MHVHADGVTPPLLLASRSPRRRELLIEARIAHEVRAADLDDGDLVAPAGCDPLHWVTALAHLKARRVADEAPERVVLGADTVVVKNGVIIGQPRDEWHAGEIVRTLRDGEHMVATGVAVLAAGMRRTLFVDVARVIVGAIDDESIDAYVASGDWRGKAGAYNLAERRAAGWPLRCAGDPATVMGLPVKRLAPVLGRLAAGSGLADSGAS